MLVIPRSRMEALTDGIFATSMTILVIDLAMPKDLKFNTSAELLDAIVGLSDPLLAYLISFFVLALFWRGVVSMRGKDDPAGAHVSAWMLYLFTMTGIPISTRIVADHGHLAPAIWVYAGNIFLCALASLLMAMTAPGKEAHRHIGHASIRLGLLMLTAILSIAISFSDADDAMWPYLLNFAAPALTAWWDKNRVAAA